MVDKVQQQPVFHHPVEVPPPPPPPPPPPADPVDASPADPVDERITAQVDEVLSPEATPEQREQAIGETRAYYDRISEGGDFEGIDDASLELNTIRTLHENGIPTIYRPEVIDAVQGAVHSASSSIGGVFLQGATPEQQLEALQLVQDHVEGVGGVGDAGILPEALPQRVDALLQEAGIPTMASAATAYVEEALDGYADMDDEQRMQAFNEAVDRLESRVDGLDPDQAAVVLASALAPIEAVAGDIEVIGSAVSGTLSQGWGTLAGLSDLVGDAYGGASLVDRLARTVLASAGGPGDVALLKPLREDGTGLAMYLHIAELVARDPAYPDGAQDIVMRDIEQALDTFIENGLEPAVADYLEHTAELSTLVQNLGPSMTPEQLQVAIDDYIAEKGPDWEQEMQSLQTAMAEDGAALLEQIEAIADLPPSLDGYRETLTARVEDLLGNNDHAAAAIAAAAGDPALVGELDLPGTIGFLDGLKLGDKGGGLLQKLADAHVQHTVLPAIGSFNPGDPASAAAVRAQLGGLRSESFANAWGIDQAQLDGAIDALEDSMPRPGDTQADIQTRLSEYDDSLQDITAFGVETPLGQAFRGLGLALGVVGAASSISGFIDAPDLAGGVQALADSAGVIRDFGELANGVGWLPDSNRLSQFAANSVVGKILGGVGIGFGLIGVADQLAEGDLLQAGIGAVGVGGGALALLGTASWTGPVGVALGVAAAAGSLVVDHFRNQAAEDSLEAAGERFLKQAGFDDAAAAILSDFSGDHYSAVGLLAQYGEQRGLTPEETIAWINGMPDQELEYLREMLNHTIDDLDGNYGGLPATTPDSATWSDEQYAMNIERHGLGVLVPGHLNPESVVQFEMALERIGIDLPA